MARTGTRRLQSVPGPTPRRADFAGLDDSIVACRSRRLGGGHDWPRLTPGKPLPRNFLPELNNDGSIRLVEVCKRCGKRRWTTSLVGGYLDPEANTAYMNPDNWIVYPKGQYSSRDFDRENYERLREAIVAKAQAARGQAS